MRDDEPVTATNIVRPPARVPPHLPLRGRHVRLRGVVPSDYEFLYDLATNDATAKSWRYRSAPPRPEEFANDLWRSVVAQYVVEHLESGERLGLVTAYDANPRDRHCYIGVLFRPDARVWPIEGVVLFLNYLFEEFAFEKLYANVIEYNLPALSSIVGRWMDCEGILRGHEWHAGQRWDVHILAMWRERFERDRGRLLHTIGSWS